MVKAKNKIALILFPAFDWEISPTHPERSERLLYTKDQLFEEGIKDIEGITFYNPILASNKDIERVHFVAPSVDKVLKKPHLLAAGGAINALDLVMSKKANKAFSITRPPGHHAMQVVYGDRGFCIINTEAVMIEHIRAKYGDLKVAIIDTDCHHGDGTENIYWNDSETLFISIHQDGRTLYPGTGPVEALGGPSAYGYNINIPLPPNTGDEGFTYVMDNVVIPILDDFKPDIIVNSAGQDNHYSDPLTNMNFSARGYAKLTEKLNADVAVLEGGYSIEGALPYINLGIVLAMAGLNYNNVIEPDFTDEKVSQTSSVTKYIKTLSEKIYNNWRNKEKLASEKFGNKEIINKVKHIYYDTSNISEKQNITYERCNDCDGITTIVSSNNFGYNLKAITIPRNSCSKCESKAIANYENTNTNDYNKIYLQNKLKDNYINK